MLLPPQKRRTAILKWFLIYEHEYENGCHKIIPNGWVWRLNIWIWCEHFSVCRWCKNLK